MLAETPLEPRVRSGGGFAAPGSPSGATPETHSATLSEQATRKIPQHAKRYDTEARRGYPADVEGGAWRPAAEA